MIYKQKLIVEKNIISQAIKDLVADQKIIEMLEYRFGLADGKEPVSLRATAHRFGTHHQSIHYHEEKIAKYLNVQKLTEVVMV